MSAATRVVCFVSSSFHPSYPPDIAADVVRSVRRDPNRRPALITCFANIALVKNEGLVERKSSKICSYPGYGDVDLPRSHIVFFCSTPILATRVAPPPLLPHPAAATYRYLAEIILATLPQHAYTHQQKEHCTIIKWTGNKLTCTTSRSRRSRSSSSSSSSSHRNNSRTRK